jgi:hypothetical protein
MAKGSKGLKGPKPSPQGVATKPQGVTLKVTVDPETARLLKLEAFGRDCSLGLVVTELVRNSPRRFVLTDRARDQLNPSGSTVPMSRVRREAQAVQGEAGPVEPESAAG